MKFFENLLRLTNVYIVNMASHTTWQEKQKNKGKKKIQLTYLIKSTPKKKTKLDKILFTKISKRRENHQALIHHHAVYAQKHFKSHVA